MPGEKFTAFLVPVPFKLALLLLGIEFFGQGCRAFALGPSLLDSTIQFLYFALETHFQVVGPGIKLFGFFREQFQIATLDVADHIDSLGSYGVLQGDGNCDARRCEVESRLLVFPHCRNGRICLRNVDSRQWLRAPRQHQQLFSQFRVEHLVAGRAGGEQKFLCCTE